MDAATMARLVLQTGFSEYQIQTYLNRVAQINPVATETSAVDCVREAALFGMDIDYLGVTS